MAFFFIQYVYVRVRGQPFCRRWGLWVRAFVPHVFQQLAFGLMFEVQPGHLLRVSVLQLLRHFDLERTGTRTGFVISVGICRGNITQRYQLSFLKSDSQKFKFNISMKNKTNNLNAAKEQLFSTIASIGISFHWVPLENTDPVLCYDFPCYWFRGLRCDLNALINRSTSNRRTYTHILIQSTIVKFVMVGFRVRGEGIVLSSSDFQRGGCSQRVLGHLGEKSEERWGKKKMQK